MLSQDWLKGVEFSNYPWLTEVFIVVLIMLTANLFVGRLLNKLAEKFARTHNLWDDALLLASRKPLILMIWVVGASHVLEIIGESTDADIFSALQPFRAVAVIGDSWLVFGQAGSRDRNRDSVAGIWRRR